MKTIDEIFFAIFKDCHFFKVKQNIILMDSSLLCGFFGQKIMKALKETFCFKEKVHFEFQAY